MKELIEFILIVFVAVCAVSVVSTCFKYEVLKYYTKEYIKEALYQPKSNYDEVYHQHRLEQLELKIKNLTE